MDVIFQGMNWYLAFDISSINMSPLKYKMILEDREELFLLYGGNGKFIERWHLIWLLKNWVESEFEMIEI